MTIEKRTTRDLLADLIYQYPAWPSTFAACAGCASSMGARGGWYCRDCVSAELIRRGVNAVRLEDLKQRLVYMQQVQEEVNAIQRELASCADA